MGGGAVARPSVEDWEFAAPNYDRANVRFMGRYAVDAMSLVGLRDEERALDVACGPGTLALLAARRGVRVTAVDFAPAMIEQLRSHVAAEKLENVEAHVMDGQVLTLPDAAFDAAFSMFGLMFFPDRLRGLGEMRRVLKPGGRAAVAGWGPPERVRDGEPWRRGRERVLPQWAGVDVGSLPAYSYQDPVALVREMRAAGFRNVRVEQVTHVWEWPSPEAFWEQGYRSLSWIRALYAEPGRIEALRREVVGVVRSEFGGGPVRLPSEANIGIGVR